LSTISLLILDNQIFPLASKRLFPPETFSILQPSLYIELSEFMGAPVVSSSLRVLEKNANRSLTIAQK
jgi:hypothetical protein